MGRTMMMLNKHPFTRTARLPGLKPRTAQLVLPLNIYRCLLNRVVSNSHPTRKARHQELSRLQAGRWQNILDVHTAAAGIDYLAPDGKGNSMTPLLACRRMLCGKLQPVTALHLQTCQHLQRRCACGISDGFFICHSTE